MGIQGLLPLLKSIMVPIHIKDLEGSSVAIDTYSWLHKGAFSCSKELCNALPTSKHIDYCMHRINLLRHYGVKPVLVFDGGLLPMKKEQEIKRARTRKENLARAMEHETNGNSAAAYDCYQKAVDITPMIAYELIQALKRENISYVVAPYEADAQMTFLAISNQNKDLNFAGFTKQMILEMCILSGCDYLQSLPGMGLKRAHALIKKFMSYDKVKNSDFSNLTYNTSIPQHIAKGIAEGDIDPCTNLPFQEQNINPGVVHEKPYKLKEFNAESVKKKLDLPVQKNVLTKYFCFASLDAKRKFRAPKQSANHSSFRDGYSISAEEPVGPEDGFPPAATYPIRNDNADGFPGKDTEHILLQQHTQPIHKPCITLHKGPDSENLPETTGEKVRQENKRVIVRSSYFKHKPECNEEQIATPVVASFTKKSMERFVSVISSFRFSSGSRASGLRAPLRDVPNSNINRSATAMDLSQFAYVPNKNKAPPKFRKGRRNKFIIWFIFDSSRRFSYVQTCCSSRLQASSVSLNAS
ncbi:Exonuclease 1, partial [Cucurbita argyrosperma subsp. argyrosperma]